MCIRDSLKYWDEGINHTFLAYSPYNASYTMPLGDGLLWGITTAAKASDQVDPVSYTHLDVYKRQVIGCGGVSQMEVVEFFGMKLVDGIHFV